MLCRDSWLIEWSNHDFSELYWLNLSYIPPIWAIQAHYACSCRSKSRRAMYKLASAHVANSHCAFFSKPR